MTAHWKFSWYMKSLAVIGEGCELDGEKVQLHVQEAMVSRCFVSAANPAGATFKTSRIQMLSPQSLLSPWNKPPPPGPFDDCKAP